MIAVVGSVRAARLVPPSSGWSGWALALASVVASASVAAVVSGAAPVAVAVSGAALVAALEVASAAVRAAAQSVAEAAASLVARIPRLRAVVVVCSWGISPRLWGGFSETRWWRRPSRRQSPVPPLRRRFLRPRAYTAAAAVAAAVEASQLGSEAAAWPWNRRPLSSGCARCLARRWLRPRLGRSRRISARPWPLRPLDQTAPQNPDPTWASWAATAATRIRDSCLGVAAVLPLLLMVVVVLLVVAAARPQSLAAPWRRRIWPPLCCWTARWGRGVGRIWWG